MMLLVDAMLLYLIAGSLVWMLTIESAARQYAIHSASLHRSRTSVLRYLTLYTILAWPRVVWGYASWYVRQIKWRRAA